ncbi:MAG: hypothetical protein AB1505_37215 [Candidatus Latescibacterota bacterium]
MSVPTKLSVLLSEVPRSREVLGRIEGYYDEYSQSAVDPAAPTRENAIVVAEILVNYYTCLETVFLRISQFFENTLDRERWHQDLLDKMLLEIEGVRPHVLSEAAHAALRELMRFRHFRRCDEAISGGQRPAAASPAGPAPGATELEFDHDWERLEFLQRKLAAVRPQVTGDLDRFTAALRAAAREQGTR